MMRTPLRTTLQATLLGASLTLIAPVAASAQSGKNALLKATMEGLPDGQTVYVYAPTEFSPKKIDSAKASGKSVAFARKPGFVRGLYMVGTAPAQSLQLILGESGVAIAGAHSEWAKAKVSGGKENVLYKEYQAITERTNKTIERIQTEFNAAAKAGFANPVEQQNQYGNARRRTDSVYQAMDNQLTTLAKANPGTFMAKAAAYLAAVPDEHSNTYLKPADFEDPELLQGDWLRSKISLWLQRYVPLDLEQWQRAAREAIEKAPKGSAGREKAYAGIVSIFYPIDQDFTRLIIRDWVKDQPNSVDGKRIAASLPPASPEVGEMAPDIVLKDSTGKDVALSSLRGKYVMIDFWASWCGPCRQENPNVVKAYQKYKDKGFTIFSVSLDNSRDRWLQAIKKDNLTWPSHVSDLKGWGSDGAKLYRVNSIPATFMVDKDGKIVARNLRGDKLEQFLAGALDQKP